MTVGELGLLWRSDLGVDLVSGFEALNCDLSFRDAVEGRCRDWRRANDAFKLSFDVTALRFPRAKVLEAVLGASGNVANVGEDDIVRFMDDLDETSRREGPDAGGTFSLLMWLLCPRSPIGMRLCLLTLRSASGVIVEAEVCLTSSA